MGRKGYRSFGGLQVLSAARKVCLLLHSIPCPNPYTPWSSPPPLSFLGWGTHSPPMPARQKLWDRSGWWLVGKDSRHGLPPAKTKQRGPSDVELGPQAGASLSHGPLLHGQALDPIFTLKSPDPQTQATDLHQREGTDRPSRPAVVTETITSETKLSCRAGQLCLHSCLRPIHAGPVRGPSS